MYLDRMITSIFQEKLSEIMKFCHLITKLIIGINLFLFLFLLNVSRNRTHILFFFLFKFLFTDYQRVMVPLMCMIFWFFFVFETILFSFCIHAYSSHNLRRVFYRQKRLRAWTWIFLPKKKIDSRSRPCIHDFIHDGIFYQHVPDSSRI